MVIFIPQNIWETQLIHLAGQNFTCHKTHRFKPKLLLQVEQTSSQIVYPLYQDYNHQIAQHHANTSFMDSVVILKRPLTNEYVPHGWVTWPVA